LVSPLLSPLPARASHGEEAELDAALQAWRDRQFSIASPAGIREYKTMIASYVLNVLDQFRRILPSSSALVVILCGAMASGGLNAFAQANAVTELLRKSRAAFDQGKNEEALVLAGKAIEREPKNPQSYYFRGRLYDAMRQFEKAVIDFDQVHKLDSGATDVYQLRGLTQFKLANIKESIADFDKYIELAPSRAPHHWQRGISLYYAGRYEDGRKQFESHQTVNDNDVENAVWHFLCVARSGGLEKARKALIAIKEDRRVPMMQVHALFAGKKKVEDVLAAAQAGEPSELKQQMFYAHLYLGLYFEVTGEAKRAEEHIAKAAGEFAEPHYMGDVARVHAKLRSKAEIK
jgi:lipoprotein NlpI